MSLHQFCQMVFLEAFGVSMTSLCDFYQLMLRFWELLITCSLEHREVIHILNSRRISGDLFACNLPRVEPLAYPQNHTHTLLNAHD